MSGVTTPLSAERRVVDLWVGLRLFTMLIAIVCSAIRPLTPREQAIPLWPPSGSILGWIERVLFAPWERWDTMYFVNVLSRGYSTLDGTLAFHPLLMMLAAPFHFVLREPIVALWIVASAASVSAVRYFYRLGRLDYDERTSELACTLLLAFPVSAILFAPYTEPLWMLCAVLCLYFCRQELWWQAGIAAALATLARQQGLFLIALMLCELWQSRSRRDVRAWSACCLPGVAYVGWMVYRSLALSDVRFDTSSFNGLIYSTLLSPQSAKVIPHQSMLPPWEAVAIALRTLHVSTLNNYLNLVLGAAFVLLVCIAWGRMRLSERVFTVIIVLVSFAYHTGPEKPYMGLPRHLLLAFPVFLRAAPVLVTGRRAHLVTALFFPGFLLVAALYVLQAWVP